MGLEIQVLSTRERQYLYQKPRSSIEFALGRKSALGQNLPPPYSQPHKKRRTDQEWMKIGLLSLWRRSDCKEGTNGLSRSIAAAEKAISGFTGLVVNSATMEGIGNFKSFILMVTIGLPWRHFCS